MARYTRDERRGTLTLDGVSYDYLIREIPFREGVELCCEVDGEDIRVSDRGLGLDEAERLLKEEIGKFKSSNFSPTRD